MKVPYNTALIEAISGNSDFYIDSTGNGVGKEPTYSVYKVVRGNTKHHPMFGDFSHMVRISEGVKPAKWVSVYDGIKSILTSISVLVCTIAMCVFVAGALFALSVASYEGSSSMLVDIITRTIIATAGIAIVVVVVSLYYIDYLDKLLEKDHERRLNEANVIIEDYKNGKIQISDTCRMDIVPL